MARVVTSQKLPDPEAVFVKAAKACSSEEARELAERHFGIIGSVEKLSSERDQNVLVTAANQQRYILKIANPAEDPSVTDLQTQVLLHIEKVKPSLPVQRMVRTKNGAFEARVELSDGSTRTVRLVTCLSGIPLHEVAPSSLLRERLGRSLAELDVSLQNFSHVAAKRNLLWNVSEAMNVSGRLIHVADSEIRELARQALASFERGALQSLRNFPSQIIHCDFNPHNILVDAIDHCRVSGILDFGDALLAPRINDVAIAASYHLVDEKSPFDGAAQVVAGYHAVSPIESEELNILPILIGARVAMTVVITSWRAEKHPENREYILRNASSARRGLRALSELSLAQARDVFRKACSEVQPHGK